jgi:hypothetical protein
MSFQISFNASQVTPNSGSMPVHEAGIYTVALVSTNEKAVKDKPGASYAEMAMQIIDGAGKGSKIVDNLNLKNPSQQAVDIAYGQLSAYCHVAGVIHIQQSLAELHGKPFKVEISKEERNDKPGQFRNNVIRLMDMQGREPGQAAPVAGVATPMAQPTQVQQPVALAQPTFTPPGQIQQPDPAAVQQPQQVQQPAGLAQPSFAQPTQPAQPAATPTPAAPGGNATPSWAQ